uniref:Protein-tyrosine phosphatase n=1 Tax=Rhabditophanes sp. KR3021 TaxID=114890 RepID=A0AC35TFN9_9BILA
MALKSKVAVTGPVPPTPTAMKDVPQIVPKEAFVSPLQIAKVASNWVRRCLERKVAGLREDFNGGLKKYTTPGMTNVAFTASNDQNRNRYRDVPCGDNQRVILKWPQYAPAPMDYIHANFVSSPISEKRFICAQGPLDTTVADFLHMIIQEETEVIIMLCNTIEKNQNKCAQYWPEAVNDKLFFTDVEVSMMKNTGTIGGDASVRKNELRLRWKGKGGKILSRSVLHIHWQDWPDRGVPPTSATPGALLSSIRGNRKPIVVHCSAGIGRTGSIVAIECILEKFYYGKECENMEILLKELRAQRAWTIQNDAQFLFVHRIVLFNVFDKFRIGELCPDLIPLYKQFIDDYDAVTAG